MCPSRAWRLPRLTRVKPRVRSRRSRNRLHLQRVMLFDFQNRRRSGESNVVRLFLSSAAIILLLSSAAKLYSLTTETRLLQLHDPVFDLPFRTLFALVGGWEIVCSMHCICSSNHLRSVGVVAWTSSAFLLYRIGLWVLDWRHPCGCLGSFAQTTLISDTALDLIARCLLLYLLVGSLGTLVGVLYSRHQLTSLRRTSDHLTT
jgi:hypothetical protein